MQLPRMEGDTSLSHSLTAIALRVSSNVSRLTSNVSRLTSHVSAHSAARMRPLRFSLSHSEIASAAFSSLAMTMRGAFRKADGRPTKSARSR